MTVARGDTQETGPPDGSVDYPLTGGKWTQAVGELDQIMGIASIAAGGGCSEHSVDARVFLDGTDIGTLGAFTPSGGSRALFGSGPYFSGNTGVYLLPPLQPADHTLTAKVEGGCSSGHYTFTKIQIAVVASK